MYIIKKLFILLIISSLVLSCKTKAKLEKKRTSELNAVYDSINSQYIKYETLLIKASTNYQNKSKKLHLKATIKIKHDSLVIISLSPGLGIEVAKIMFTKDSIFILDRLSSQLTKGNYQFIKNKYKIDVGYFDIQSVLTNELFIYPKKKSSSIRDELLESYMVKENQEYFDLYRKTNQLVENLISINTIQYRINKYIVNDIANKRNLNIKFDDNYSEEFNNLPKKINVVSFVNNSYIKIRLNYSKIVKNKALNFSFRVPKKYKIVVY